MVPTILLVRHGRTSANDRGVLAGRSPGVTLDEVGQEQATSLATRLAAVPFATIVASLSRISVFRPVIGLESGVG